MPLFISTCRRSSCYSRYQNFPFRPIQHIHLIIYLSSVHSIAVLVWAYNVGELFITAQVGRVYSDERVSERGQNLNHFWIPNLMLLQTTSLQYTQIDRKGELSRYIKPRTPSRELDGAPQQSPSTNTKQTTKAGRVETKL